MLKQDEIEKITFDAMDKFARENAGSIGWRKSDFIDGVMGAGGDMEDVYECMALGMELCCVEGHRIPKNKNNN